MMEVAPFIPASAGLRLTFFIPDPTRFRRTLHVPIPLRNHVVADIDSVRPMESGVSDWTTTTRWWKRWLVPPPLLDWHTRE
jgi:hypothetical protein